MKEKLFILIQAANQGVKLIKNIIVTGGDKMADNHTYDAGVDYDPKFNRNQMENFVSHLLVGILGPDSSRGDENTRRLHFCVK